MAVNLSMLAGAGFQFLDNNGDPLTGGKIYTYLAGTTTPVTTYTTNAGTTAHTNPIILDAAGRVPSGGEIWLTNGISHKFVVKTSTEVTIGTYDNILNNIGNVYSSLSAPDGSSLIGYQPAGTGAVATNVQGKLRETVSVFDFMTAVQIADVKAGTASIDVTDAIQAANTFAAANGRKVLFPKGSYLYAPSGRIDITVAWEGECDINTIIQCDSASYTGVFFRVVTGSVSNIRIRNKTQAKLGTGVQLAAANIDEFTSHIRLGPQLTVVGFDKNIDIHNTYQVVFDQVRSQFGAEGLYCAPADAAGDNGYINTHTHINCFYSDNDRNVYYAPALGSQCVEFVGGAIQAATGASQQAYFSQINHLNFASMYCEGASTIPAIEVTSCSVVVNGLYMKGTGGLKATGNGQLELTNIRGYDATDSLSIPASASTIKANLTDVSLPTSGNDISGIDIGTIRSSFINNVSYGFRAIGGSSAVQIAFPATAILSSDANTLDDYEEGTWTPQISFATAGNLSVAYSAQVGRYTKIGNTVIAHFWITTSTFTHSTASGNVRIAGLPFTVANVTDLNPMGALVWQGITKANYTNICSMAVQNQDYAELRASGSGQSVSPVSVSDMPSGGTVSFRGTLVYQTSL